MTQTTDIKCENVNVLYGENHALKNIDMAIKPVPSPPLLGSCCKSTFHQLNRMNDLIDNARHRLYLIDGEDVNAPDTDVVDLVAGGHGISKPNPFPKSIYENVAYGPSRPGRNRTELNDRVEQALRRAGLWDEVSDRQRTLAWVFLWAAAALALPVPLQSLKFC